MGGAQSLCEGPIAVHATGLRCTAKSYTVLHVRKVSQVVLFVPVSHVVVVHAAVVPPYCYAEP
eukprot:4746282-Pleurochrysis_carterae.AAC.1